MSEANVVFNFNGQNIKIQCKKEEKMKDICERYVFKIQKNLNTLLFIYDGSILKFELSFEEQANSIDRNIREMKVSVYTNDTDEFICPKCGEKIELNNEKYEIILINDNIKDRINRLKSIIENMIKNSIIDSMNNQLKNINILLNSINEDIKKNNDKIKNLLKDNNIIDNNKNIIRGLIDINSYEINNDIILFNTDNNNDIDVYINNKKINIIKENNKWKYKFEKEGKYILEIIFNNNITNMKQFFEKCTNIISLDFTKFNTENVDNMELMFNECYKLKEIKGINKFNTRKVTDMSAMFQGCYELEYLDLSNFDTTKVIDYSCMFSDCNKLKEIKGINKFIIKNITNISQMFQECKSEKLDLSNFDTSNISSLKMMFYKCYNLKELYLLNFSIPSTSRLLFSFVDKEECQLTAKNEQLHNIFINSDN